MTQNRIAIFAAIFSDEESTKRSQTRRQLGHFLLRGGERSGGPRSTQGHCRKKGGGRKSEGGPAFMAEPPEKESGEEENEILCTFLPLFISGTCRVV